MSRRVCVALAIGIACGLASWLSSTRIAALREQDFGLWWEAARALLRHQDPYSVVRSKMGVMIGTPIFYYPLPTAIATIPFAWVPVQIAGPIFLGASCALLAFVATAQAWWPLLMFLSGSMLMTIISAQASALITAALFAPALTWVGVFKPNYGLALLAYRLSWKSAMVMLAIATASLMVMPTWPQEWIASAMSSTLHFAPWHVPGGVLLLAVLLRWRRPEARMIAVLALVPAAPVVYDALQLFVVAKTRREMLMLAMMSSIMFLAMTNLSILVDPDAYMARAGPAMLWLMYVPAAVMVLRRPNEGALPAWLERTALRLPSWIRGMPA